MLSAPSQCLKCGDLSVDHWFWQDDSRYTKGGVFRPRCLKRAAGKRYRHKRNGNLLRREKYIKDGKQRYKTNPATYKFNAYSSYDKRYHPSTHTINRSNFEELIQKSCFYCCVPNAMGLDRIDNGQGHSFENVVPCCEKCNMILGDLPFKAKQILGQGLRTVQELKLLTDWVIPIKRKSYKKCHQ